MANNIGLRPFFVFFSECVGTTVKADVVFLLDISMGDPYNNFMATTKVFVADVVEQLEIGNDAFL